MQCTKCNHTLPDDSIFCQYCGSRTEAKSVITNVASTPKFSTVDSPVEPHKDNAIKRKHCSRCGAIVDSKNKICTGCGRKYFRGFRINKFSVTVAVMVLLFAAMSMLLIFQNRNTQELLKTTEATINQLETRIDDLERDARKANARIKHLEYDLSKFLD